MSFRCTFCGYYTSDFKILEMHLARHVERQEAARQRRNQKAREKRAAAKKAATP